MRSAAPAFKRPHLRYHPALLALVLLAGKLTAAAQPPVELTSTSAPQPWEERGVLNVGATTDNYPYSYTDADGKLTGFSVDLLNAVARAMNMEIRRSIRPGRELQQRFQSGEFDILQQFSQSNDRDAYADFSVPYLTLRTTIAVNENDASIKTLADFAGRDFAIIGTNSIGERFLRDHALQPKIVYVPSITEGLQGVAAGKYAGMFVAHLTALTVIDAQKIGGIAFFDQEPLSQYDIRHCYAVHKGDAHLLARLNEGLAILHRNGEFDRIYNHWFGRITAPLISREQVVRYGSLALVVALLAALAALQHQRTLRHRIARQAAELAGQKTLLQTLYDNIPLAMCVADITPDGPHLLSINRHAEEYFGLPAAEVAGRRLADLAPGSEWLTHLTELLQHGLTTRAHFREERRLATLNKRLLFTIVPMSPDAAGHPRLCVLAEDITERRNLDDEIAQSRKLRAIGELVGGIAHEFNNLLTPIMLKVGEIQMDWAHEPALLKDTRLIADAVQRSAELTQRLLTFGRKTDRRAENIHLGAVIGNCFSLLRLTMDRRILWEQAVPADLPSIYLSATDVNQIILNLLINARDTLVEKLARQPGNWIPVIRVEARHLPADALPAPHAGRTPLLGWQQLTIRDNGLGMPPEVRERIFEPFFTTKDVGKGTGLGLATVWHMVTEVSGRIEVESTPGEGTTFTITLPMLPPPAPAADTARAQTAAPHTARIFLAEDDQLVATTIIATLQRARHTVTHLANGAHAWDHLQDRLDQYDLILLDVNMPGLDGIELAQRIRATGRYAGHLLIASGRLTSNDLEQLAEIKIDAILNKPFTAAELLEAVRTSLAR